MFDGHQQEIYSLDFSADGRLIVSGSGDKTARIWNMENSESKVRSICFSPKIHLLTSIPQVLTIADPDASDAGVTSVAISASGHLVAAGSLDAVVRIWDANTGNILERLRGHRDSVYSVAFTPDGKGLVSGSLDKTLKYWDMSGLVAAIKAGKPVPVAGKLEGNSPCTMNFTGHKDYVLSVAVSHDGQWVVSGSKDRGVQFWDSRTAIVQCMLQGHKNSGAFASDWGFCLCTADKLCAVISIDLSPAGNVLATGSGDWQARICTSTSLVPDCSQLTQGYLRRELPYHLIRIRLRASILLSPYDVSSLCLVRNQILYLLCFFLYHIMRCTMLFAVQIT